MSKSVTTSVYSYVGNSTATLNSLTGNTDVTPLNLSDLNLTNYPSKTTPPNENNQLIFMKQPVSWWVTELNNGNIKYTPYSNYVNWSYLPNKNANVYISRDVSTLIIPDSIKTSVRNNMTKVTTNVFNAKYGMNRTDTVKD
jgi:hypothetical protein